MIKEGQEKRARYWGKFKVEKVVKLPQPVICHSEEIGEAEFLPTIVQIDWEKPPSSDNHKFWLPYWIKVKGRWKYGQFAPMIGGNVLLHLLKEAIMQDFLVNSFCRDWRRA